MLPLVIPVTANFDVQTHTPRQVIRKTKDEQRMALDPKKENRLLDDPILIVGRVTEINGKVTVTRSESGKRRLFIGDAIFRGDDIETGERSWVTVTMDDGTEMTLGASAQLSLDRYFFDGIEGSGILDVWMLAGSFYITSGVMTGYPNSIVAIRTPNAVLKLPPPGGVIAGKYIDRDEVSLFTLLADNFGRAGNAEVATRSGKVQLNSVNQTTVALSFNRNPTKPVVLTRLDLFDLFGLFRDRGWQYSGLATRRLKILSDDRKPTPSRSL